MAKDPEGISIEELEEDEPVEEEELLKEDESLEEEELEEDEDWEVELIEELETSPPPHEDTQKPVTMAPINSPNALFINLGNRFPI